MSEILSSPLILIVVALVALMISYFISSGVGVAALTALALSPFSWKKTVMWVVGLVAVGLLLFNTIPGLESVYTWVAATVDDKSLPTGALDKFANLVNEFAHNTEEYEWIWFALGGMLVMVFWREKGDKMDAGEIFVRIVLVALSYLLATMLASGDIDQRIIWFVVAIVCVRVWHLAGLFATVVLYAFTNMFF